MKIEIPTMDMVLTKEDISELSELAKQPFPENAPVIKMEELKNAMKQ